MIRAHLLEQRVIDRHVAGAATRPRNILNQKPP
jgi:hypothetical protein